MKCARELPSALLAFALACGGRQVSNAAPSEAGIADTSVMDAVTAAPPPEDGTDDSAVMNVVTNPLDGGLWDGRAPLNHRAAASTCPQQRAAISPTQSCSCTSPDGGACSCGQCNKDSDCDGGPNGRCGDFSPLPGTECSYDECFSDSDCGDAGPCQCRTSGSSANANGCSPGSSCVVDSDCGPGGYCSPSRFNQWCGASYHCHTLGDICIDNSDCAGALDGCNFSAANGTWACDGGCGPPPP